ncbi:MAG: phosphoglucosamine mutase [Candidatus Woesearchaeota archaeon]
MERKFFGTDGIRGKANTFPMTAEVALKLAQAAALSLLKGYSSEGLLVNKLGSTKPKVVIGKDTRLSGYIFEFALTSGFNSMGIDVYLVGPMPTPAIAHLTRSFAADLGIVISASHNPAEDNGIKFFDKDGYKLSDNVEYEIEQLMLENIETSHINGRHVGKAYRIGDAQGRYIEFAKGSINNLSLLGLKIVLDCANGAAYRVAPLVFTELGADVVVFNNQPDGLNINKECGALYPSFLQAKIKELSADFGVALDGDADRLIMVDDEGKEVDGDMLLGMSALHLKEQGRLKNNTLVCTVLSNLGFEKSMRDSGISVVRTKVGDRYVIEEMKKNGYTLGGEQSGHLIFGDYNTTGDGIIAALQIASIVKQSGKRLSELKKCILRYPQVMISFNVREKRPIEEMNEVCSIISSAEKSLGNSGRIIVRYSGTEKKCRVMVEAKDEKVVKKLAKRIADAIKKEIGD